MEFLNIRSSACHTRIFLRARCMELTTNHSVLRATLNDANRRIDVLLGACGSGEQVSDGPAGSQPDLVMRARQLFVSMNVSAFCLCAARLHRTDASQSRCLSWSADTRGVGECPSVCRNCTTNLWATMRNSRLNVKCFARAFLKWYLLRGPMLSLEHPASIFSQDLEKVSGLKLCEECMLGVTNCLIQNHSMLAASLCCMCH